GRQAAGGGTAPARQEGAAAAEKEQEGDRGCGGDEAAGSLGGKVHRGPARCRFAHRGRSLSARDRRRGSGHSSGRDGRRGGGGSHGAELVWNRRRRRRNLACPV